MVANKQHEYNMMLANKYYMANEVTFGQVALKSSCSQCLIRFHIPAYTYIYLVTHERF